MNEKLNPIATSLVRTTSMLLVSHRVPLRVILL